MKIRTDFVTNSSSSSFVLEIGFYLKDGRIISFEANGGTPESGRIDYFECDALVKVSPRELGTAESVEEMIQLLTDGVVDFWWEGEEKIFANPEPHTSDAFEAEYNAGDFIENIRKNITSMDDIEMIVITGNEYNYENYLRTFSYNRTTGEYKGEIEGCELECDGSSGGNLVFSLEGCDIKSDEDGECDETEAAIEPEDVTAPEETTESCAPNSSEANNGEDETDSAASFDRRFVLTISVYDKDDNCYVLDTGSYAVDPMGNAETSFAGKLKDAKKCRTVDELARFLTDHIVDDSDLCDEFLDESGEPIMICDEFFLNDLRNLKLMSDKCKTEFTEKLTQGVRKIRHIRRITLTHDYYAWGEFADLIPDNDAELERLCRKVNDAKRPFARKRTLKKLRKYINTPNADRAGEQFGVGYKDIRYAWSGDDEALLKLAERCGCTTGGGVEGKHYDEINMKNGKVVRYAEFVLE